MPVNILGFDFLHCLILAAHVEDNLSVKIALQWNVGTPVSSWERCACTLWCVCICCCVCVTNSWWPLCKGWRFWDFRRLPCLVCDSSQCGCSGCDPWVTALGSRSVAPRHCGLSSSQPSGGGLLSAPDNDRFWFSGSLRCIPFSVNLFPPSRLSSVTSACLLFLREAFLLFL